MEAYLPDDLVYIWDQELGDYIQVVLVRSYTRAKKRWWVVQPFTLGGVEEIRTLESNLSRDCPSDKIEAETQTQPVSGTLHPIVTTDEEIKAAIKEGKKQPNYFKKERKKVKALRRKKREIVEDLIHTLIHERGLLEEHDEGTEGALACRHTRKEHADMIMVLEDILYG
jgi:hypothetical protein